MKEGSSIENVFGKNLTEENKQEIQKSYENIFRNQSFEELKSIEKGKTPEQLEMVSLANKATNEIQRHYGPPDFDVPEKNIHVIKADKWRSKGGALFVANNQAIAIKETDVRLQFAKHIIHEMIHFKSYGAAHVREKDRVLDDYRCGLTVYAREDGTRYLGNLNEAVTEELAKRVMLKELENPIFQKEVKETERIKQKYPNPIDEEGNPFFTEDTYEAHIAGAKGKNIMIETENFTYQKERNILWTLIDKIHISDSRLGENRKFKDREEIFQMFARAAMTGNLLPLGRTVEKMFGKGTLQKIGKLDSDLKKQKVFIEDLRNNE